jgi:hypothetical protein
VQTFRQRRVDSRNAVSNAGMCQRVVADTTDHVFRLPEFAPDEEYWEEETHDTPRRRPSRRDDAAHDAGHTYARSTEKVQSQDSQRR